MVEVSTSILSIDKENAIKTLYNIETAKTDYFHIDVMDGKFVKNNTNDVMLEYCEASTMKSYFVCVKSIISLRSLPRAS